MKIAVLTSLFGSNSALRSLTDEENGYGVDYYAFVDRKHEGSTGWNQIVSPEYSYEPVWVHRRNAKIYKILPDLFLPDYDVHIWIDSGHIVIKNPHVICDENLGNSDIAIFSHPLRVCAYSEAQTVDALKIEHRDILSQQLQYFRSVGFPRNDGLYEMGCFVRRKNDITSKMGLMWWEMICRFSSRDQISFPYVLWKLKDDIKISKLSGHIGCYGGGNEICIYGQQPELVKKY